MKVIEGFKPSLFGAWIIMNLPQFSPEDGLSEKWLGGEGGKEGGMEGGGGGWGNEGSKRCMNVLTIFN